MPAMFRFTGIATARAVALQPFKASSGAIRRFGLTRATASYEFQHGHDARSRDGSRWDGSRRQGGHGDRRSSRWEGQRGGDRWEDGERGSRGGVWRRSQGRRAGRMDGAAREGFTLGPNTEVVRVTEEEGVVSTPKSLVEEGVLSADLYEMLQSRGFETLTPVQQKTLRPILQTEHDVVARAKTGTGKTLAFLMPVFQRLLEAPPSDNVKAVVIAPTRDLAAQIFNEINEMRNANRKLRRFNAVVMMGGSSRTESFRSLQRKRPNIVVATPGRLIDMLEACGPKYFTEVDFKVLDEADTLLEIGFKQALEQINELLNQLNQKGTTHIRTLLVSATLDDKVQSLANSIMNHEKCLFIDTVDPTEQATNENIAQKVVISKDFADNITASLHKIRQEVLENPSLKAIVFMPTIVAVEYWGELLQDQCRGTPVLLFHGGLTQGRRNSTMKRFRAMPSGILVCTDVAARGMDVSDVQHVYQVGVPTSPDNYIHRIGRTGRAGRKGSSTIFLAEHELCILDILKKKSNVVISDQETFDEAAQDVSTVREAFALDRDRLHDFLLKNLSFYRGSQGEYGFPLEAYMSIARAYGALLGDRSERLTLPGKMLTTFVPNHPAVCSLFNITGPIAGKSNGFRSSNKRHRMGRLDDTGRLAFSKKRQSYARSYSPSISDGF
ncbi:AaceriAGL112Cp [[Ashbya] aceris (nom. inval.)]|nr:AaceriAGL112Cp [[Ashbya] aceris (nom. inval.)]